MIAITPVFIATIPTVGDALEALEDICTDLSEILKQIADIAVEIDSREHVGLERLQHVGYAFIFLTHRVDIRCRSSPRSIEASGPTSTLPKSDL